MKVRLLRRSCKGILVVTFDKMNWWAVRLIIGQFFKHRRSASVHASFSDVRVTFDSSSEISAATVKRIGKRLEERFKNIEVSYGL